MPKKAYQSFVKLIDGTNVVISSDDFYADDHPYVRAWPEMFADMFDLVKIHHASEVEQATAAPGEVRRGPGRPRKDSYLNG
jgi:hypothetical protein